MKPSSATDLRRIQGVWGLTDRELAQVLHIEPSVARAWIKGGVPDSHTSAVKELGAATSALQSRLTPDIVAEVVRRSAPSLEGLSLVEFAIAHTHQDLRQAVEQMFDLRRTQP